MKINENWELFYKADSLLGRLIAKLNSVDVSQRKRRAALWAAIGRVTALKCRAVGIN